MERCLVCRLWKPIWKWLEEVDRLTGQRIRLGGLCRGCSGVAVVSGAAAGAEKSADARPRPTV